MKESELIEFKRSTGELKEAVISICAILNKHQQGELFFGIKNDGEVVGQQVTEKTIRDVSKSISDHLEPKIFPKVNEVTMEGKKCIHIEFLGDDIPYFAFGRSYIRVGDEDKQVSPQELRRLFKKQNETAWEKGISERTIKEINVKTLREFIVRANKAKRINFGYSNAETVLNKLGLLKDGKLLRAAEVLFCDKNDTEVQAAVFAGKDKLTFLDISQFKGNLFQLLQKSESYVKERINWRANLTRQVREEIPEIPVRAITEALVNSLCHKDYTNLKGNEVAIFKDRVEIYNPGLFPEGYDPKDFFKGTERSILRNPIIANILYLSSDIERWGSGIKRIHDACKEKNVKVDFKKLKSGFLVVFYRRTTPEVENISVRDGVNLTPNQKKIFEKIKDSPHITAEEMSTVVNINKRNVEKNLSKLQQLGIIKRIGPDKGGHWEVK